MIYYSCCSFMKHNIICTTWSIKKAAVVVEGYHHHMSNWLLLQITSFFLCLWSTLFSDHDFRSFSGTSMLDYIIYSTVQYIFSLLHSTHDTFFGGIHNFFQWNHLQQKCKQYNLQHTLQSQSQTYSEKELDDVFLEINWPSC